MAFVEEDAPKERRLAAVDELAVRDKEIITTNVELSDALGRVKDECRQEIRSLIGSDKLGAYEKLHQKKMLRLEDLATGREHTAEAANLEAKARRRLLVEARKFVESLEVDARQIEEVQKKHIAEARSLVERGMRGLEAAPYVDLTDAEVPAASHNPWAWRSPPYTGQWGTQWSYGTRGWRSVSHFESRTTGEIDCWSSQEISGADDSDYTYTNAYSELQFWFQMPAAGLVEVWLYLQAINTPYGGCLEDEWGWSDADIRERSRPYLWVLSPYGSPRYATLVDYPRGEDEGCWSFVVATPGQFRYAHLFSLDSYAAGQWILCGVGIHDYDYFWVNDMTCRTDMTSRWFLKNVAVRSTGAP